MSTVNFCGTNSHGEQGRPFLKWPGGKRWLANKIISKIAPRLANRYFEPFLGGGAVFFMLQPDNATLSDINPDLINVYRQVRDKPEALLERIKRRKVTKENYYRIREQHIHHPLQRAVRFLYLNRTAFGGIYRLNRRGQFNVPYGGGQRTPSCLWEQELIKAASRALKGKTLLVSDFEEVMEKARNGDVVYCDPTYTVAHENNGFLRYNEKNFSWEDQKRLASAARRAVRHGATVIVSNAFDRSLLDLYWPSKPVVYVRNSLVSPNPAERRQVRECLFILKK